MFGNLQNVKQMMATIKSAKNPQVVLNTMMNNNPQLKQVKDYIQQNGGNAQQAFYSLAKQNGVDPKEILDMLK